jgi:hypothetical protein
MNRSDIGIRSGRHGRIVVEEGATYEIFKKELDNTTLRVESVKGIDEAQKALEKS